jgi:hypothetical protein
MHARRMPVLRSQVTMSRMFVVVLQNVQMRDLSHPRIKKAPLPKWPVPGGTPPTIRLNGPRECTLLEHQNIRRAPNTIPCYERPPSTYHCYTMQPHIVYIPNWLVRLVLSLYWRVGLLFVLMGRAPGRHAFSALPPGGRPDHRQRGLFYARM